MEEYYFISYWYKGAGIRESMTRPYNEVIDVHPLKWQHNMLEEYRYSGEGDFVLLSWHKISKEQYEEYKDKIEW